MRLPELDEKVVKIRPSPRDHFSKDSPDVAVDLEGDQVGGQINGDCSEISMLGSDGSKCRGDPFDSLRSGPENDITEFCRFREVERVWLAFYWW